MSTPTPDALYDWLLAQEVEGNDDRRFYASYLLGHVSLAIADTEDAPEQFSQRLTESIDIALAEDKLSEQDISGIRALLAEAVKS